MYKGALLPVELLLCGPHQTGMQGFSSFIDTGRDFKECYFCLGDSLYARPGNGGPQDVELMEVWYSTRC